MARKRKSKKGSAKKKATKKRSAKKTAAKAASTKKTSAKKTPAKKTSTKKTPNAVVEETTAEGGTAVEERPDEPVAAVAKEDDVEIIDLDAELAELEGPDAFDFADLEDEPDIEVINLDDEDDLDDGPDVEVSALDEGADIEVVDLDDEAGDTQRLIAETLAIAEGAGSDEPHERQEEASADAVAADEAADAAEEAYLTAEGTDPDAAQETENGPPTDPELVLTADAIRALSAIHREGLASLPEELILDLGEAATADERDQLLRAAMAHAEMREAVYRVPTDADRTAARLKGLVAATILIAAMFVWARPPALIVPEPPVQLTMADREHGVRVALLLQAQQIEAFRARSERLPDSLAEVPVQFPGIRFVKSSNRIYQLIAYLPDGEAVVYDTAAPEAEFEAIELAWASERGGS